MEGIRDEPQIVGPHIIQKLYKDKDKSSICVLQLETETEHGEGRAGQVFQSGPLDFQAKYTATRDPHTPDSNLRLDFHQESDKKEQEASLRKWNDNCAHHIAMVNTHE